MLFDPSTLGFNQSCHVGKLLHVKSNVKLESQKLLAGSTLDQLLHKDNYPVHIFICLRALSPNLQKLCGDQKLGKVWQHNQLVMIQRWYIPFLTQKCGSVSAYTTTSPTAL